MTRSLRFVLTAALALTPGLLLAGATPAAAGTGLRYVEVQKNGVGTARNLDGARGVAVSPDGKHVYVASRLDDAIVVFRRDAAQGRLEYVESHKHVDATDGLNGAHGVTVSPDGKNVYVVSDIDDTIVAYARDASTGALTFLQLHRDGVSKVNGLDGAEGVTVSPDGLFVYAAGAVDNGIAIFGRNPDTGLLTYVDVVKNNTSAFFLASVKSLAITADGKFLYCAASADDAVSAFSRDVVTGRLSQVQIVINLQNGITGLDKARSVALSPDGASLYVAGGLDDAIAVFGRDATTGFLTELEVEKDSTGGVNGLNGSSGVVVSPDGLYVYSTGDVDDSLAIFSRDPATGLLNYIAREHDGSKTSEGLTIDGLNNATGVAVSPDDMNVYAVGYIDDAVSVFRRRFCGDAWKDPGEQCDDGNNASGDCCSPTCELDAAGTACTDDTNVCTDDVCDGRGICLHPANTAPCDDGAFCTDNDVCAGGACHGTLHDCSAAGDQCNDGVCDENLKACVPQAKTDGTSCDDGLACTRPDVCTAGVCSGAPVVCAIADACHDGGICDPGTGLCPNARPDGTPCNDGNACTRTDSCQQGLCTGSNATICTAADQCHVAGACNTSTGVCSNPAKPNGAACSDGNACTQTDTCEAGVCTGSDQVTCTASDQCHVGGVCDGSTGLCSNPARPDGSPCDDGDAKTADDACTAGICRGALLADTDGDGIADIHDVCPQIADPDQKDTNGDGVGDACSCADPAPGRCIGGGGPPKTDCLVELNPQAPATPNKKRSNVNPVLRCADGDARCDADGHADGHCTFALAVCFANSDPRIACQPGDVRDFEVLSPNADKARSEMDRANALALERTIGGLGVAVKRAGRILTAASSPAHDMCSPLVQIAVPAPTGGKPMRRVFKLKGTAVDGRVDVDRLTLECTK